MKLAHLVLIIGCTWITACQPQPNTTQLKQSKGAVLSLQLLDSDNRVLLIRDGAKLTIYKDQQRLQELVVEDNQVQLQAVQEAPPYRFKISQLFVDGYESDRGVPIDTQGGLIVPKTPSALPLPPELILPSSSPGASIDGEIKQDLRQTAMQTIQLNWPSNTK